MNKTVIYQCPNSYFEDYLYLIHKRLCEFHYFKRYNIPQNPDNISMLELESCSILDLEIEKFNQQKNDEEIKKKEKKDGHRTKFRN